MASSSDSDISVSPSIFSGSGSDTSPTLHSHSFSRLNTQQPRLTSPRLFRDLFSSTSTNTAARTLPPARFQETSQDVTGALADASRAVQNAQHALQLPPIVDLTESSPSQSPESEFLSSTTHPHDARARQTSRHRNPTNSLQEPVYGSIHSPARTASSRIIAMSRQRNLSSLIPSPIRVALARGSGDAAPGNLDFHDYYPHVPTEEEIRREESRAINRQRTARALWEHNQRDRARQLDPHTSKKEPKKESESSSSPAEHSPEIESVDLTQLDENSSLADALSKQRREAVSSQITSLDAPTGRSVLTSFKCPICMETPKNATTTICGHLFCHHCIMDALKWVEGQNRDNPVPGKNQGVCPVCRKVMNRKDRPGGGRSLIPLELKVVTGKRKRDGGKGKERARDESEVVDLEKLERAKEKDRAKSAEMWNELTEVDLYQ